MNQGRLHCINVALGERSYPIDIGLGLLQRADAFPLVKNRGLMIIAGSPVVSSHYLECLQNTLRTAGARRLHTCLIPDGETSKNSHTLGLIYDALLTTECDRHTIIIALGGGVVGDLAGFAAATYQRGIDFIQIPTTLLSQVDSSVGGKTGINHPQGKNMIGAFHQPIAVVADIQTLNTLPKREIAAGLAEVIKYGFIADPSFLSWLETNIESLIAREPMAMGEAVYRSCQIKAQVVAQDERDRGIREHLNLGHTFGHAIETGMGYGNWSHGEAVASGMVLAARLSQRLGYIDAASVNRIQKILERAGLPVKAPSFSGGVHGYLDIMRRDKKASEGAIRYVLLRKIGEACVEAVPDDIVAEVLNSAGVKDG